MVSLLAIQLKRIGDLVLTLPALEALRRSYPAANVTLVIDGGCAGLVPAIQSVNRVLIYRKGRANLKLWSRVLLKHYDVAFDFSGTDRSSALTLLSKARKRIAFEPSLQGELRTSSYTHLVESPVLERHTVDHNLDLVSSVGLPPTLPDLRIEPSKPARAQARKMLRQHGVHDRPYVVLHVGAARAEKYWQPESWAGVIRHCRALGRTCVLIGGSSPMECEAIAEVQALVEPRCVDIAGQLSLLASTALIEGADLFIGVDSGPSHLAAAVKVPQITLFGPTNPFHWRARHDRSLILQGGKNNPLIEFEPDSPAGNLKDLSTDEVIHAINLLLV